MRKLKFFLSCVMLLVVGFLAYAQNINVSGTVTDAATGEGVPFASIQVKGTMTGTATDADGNYTISVPRNATLIFSSIGYINQEAEVAGRTVINILLAPDTESLDELVVVAYGVAKKESLTGAISTVKSDEIAKRPVSSVTDVLEGMTTGVMVNSTYGAPGEDASIRIRGFGSVNGSNTPLYVLDGVPFGGNVSDLNPNDIESITVLKDATSAALYGNRASNGVIMITTKRGKTDKVSFSASVNQGVYMRGIPEYDKLGPNDWMEMYFEGYSNYLLSSNPARYPDKATANAEAIQTTVNNIGYNIYNQPDNALFGTDGKLVSGAQIRSGYDDLDWYKAVERIGHRQEYNVSGSGASDKSNYYFSMGYLNEKGQIDYSDFSRWTGRANVSVTPKKWLKAGITLNGSMQENNGISTGTSTIANPLYFARMIAPVYPIYRHDPATGAYILDENGNKQFSDGEGRAQLSGRNVIWENELDTRQTRRNTLGGQAFADIMFLKDFTFTVKADISLRNSRYRSHSNPIIGDGKGNNGRASREEYNYMNYTFQQLLNWNHEFGNHTVELLAGHENYQYGYDYEYGYKTDESFAGGIELDNFNSITSLDGHFSSFRLESFLGRIKYDYLNKYFIEGSFRRDGSSRFAPGHKWGNFWSAGATWVISREEFMKNAGWVDNLKFRASYGQVGNDASVGYYGYYALYSLHQYSNQPASYKTQNEATDIKWESANTFSTALEGRLFNRMNFIVEYFDKTTADLLFDVYQPLSAGGTSTSSAVSVQTMNLGSVSNRGFELSMDVDVVRTKDFVWNIGANATLMRNKILTLPEQNREEGILNGTKLLMEGHSIYAFYLYQYAGVDQMTGRALYLPDDKNFYHGTAGESESRTVIPDEWYTEINGKPYVLNTTYAKKDWAGDAIPKVMGSFNTSVSWKDFSFSALFTYALGGKLIDSSYMGLMSSSTSPHALHADLAKSWKAAPSGMTATSPDRISMTATPSFDMYWSSYSNATSTRFLEKSDYLVIKNVNLSYRLPKRMVQAIDLSGITISAAVDNLFTFAAMKGLNPQQSFNGTVDNYFNTPRVVTFGINVTL